MIVIKYVMLKNNKTKSKTTNKTIHQINYDLLLPVIEEAKQFLLKQNPQDELFVANITNLIAYKYNYIIPQFWDHFYNLFDQKIFDIKIFSFNSANDNDSEKIYALMRYIKNLKGDVKLEMINHFTKHHQIKNNGAVKIIENILYNCQNMVEPFKNQELNKLEVSSIVYYFEHISYDYKITELIIFILNNYLNINYKIETALLKYFNEKFKTEHKLSILKTINDIIKNNKITEHFASQLEVFIIENYKSTELIYAINTLNLDINKYKDIIISEIKKMTVGELWKLSDCKNFFNNISYKDEIKEIIQKTIKKEMSPDPSEIAEMILNGSNKQSHMTGGYYNPYYFVFSH